MSAAQFPIPFLNSQFPSSIPHPHAWHSILLPFSMKRRIPFIASFATGLVAGIIIIILLAFREKPEKDITAAVKGKSDESGVHTWYSPSLPEKMDFAGEPVPLDRWEIREQLDRELLYNYYWQNNILYVMKLAGRYFPMIEERLKANNIPDDFKYLCIAESNLQNATSRAGAVGFWQFMKGTAPAYGMEISSTIDERYNVLKSTEAACKYLKEAYAKFGSWTAAAASYNCGMGGYNSHSNFQGTKNYYDLLLPEETQRYIFRILAFKHLMSNAADFGFSLAADEKYAPVKVRTISVNQSIPDLAVFAMQNGTSYKMLRMLNPWIRDRSLKIKTGKTYTLTLPAN